MDALVSHPYLCAATGAVVLLYVHQTRNRQPIVTNESWESHVRPHDPLEEIVAGRLWRLQGTWQGQGPPLRNMVIYKTSSGDLIVHNGVACDEETVTKIQQLGNLAVLIVPNGCHRADAKVWKDRFPKMKVACPRGCRDGVSQVLPVEMDVQELAHLYPECVKVHEIEGLRWKEWELMYEFSLGERAALCVSDLLFNLRPTGQWVDLIGHMFSSFGKNGRPVMSRLGRWFFATDKPKVRAFFLGLGSRKDIEFIVVGHGEVARGDCASMLREVAASL